MSNPNHLKDKVALFYKGFLWIMLISQTVLFFIMLLNYGSWLCVFNMILIIYFSIRLYVFIKVDSLAKENGMTLYDYMKKFEEQHKDF